MAVDSTSVFIKHINWLCNFNYLYIIACRGPSDAVLNGSDQPQVNVTALTKGLYVFQLTAWDDSGVSGNDNVTVSVRQSKFTKFRYVFKNYILKINHNLFFFFSGENEKPKANAGGDQSVSLPLKWVILNGSSSTDDQGIQSWLWTREPESLAAGAIIANSDRTSTLMVIKCSSNYSSV